MAVAEHAAVKRDARSKFVAGQGDEAFFMVKIYGYDGFVEVERQIVKMKIFECIQTPE